MIDNSEVFPKPSKNWVNITKSILLS